MGKTVIQVKRYRGLLLVAVTMYLLVSGSCGKEPSEQQQAEPEKIVLKDTDVPLTGLDGSTTTLSEFKGRVVVLNFWVTWNKDCLELISTMNALNKKFRGRAVILGVAIDDKGEHVMRHFIDEHKIQYPVFINGERTAKAFGGVGKLPTTLLYRKDGTLHERIKGNRRQKYYNDRIINLILDHL